MAEESVAVVKLAPGIQGEDLALTPASKAARKILEERTMRAGKRGGHVRAMKIRAEREDGEESEPEEGDVPKGQKIKGETPEQRKERQRAYQRAYQERKRAERAGTAGGPRPKVSGGGKTRAVRPAPVPESSGVTLLSNGFAVTIAPAGDGLSIQVRRA